MNPDLSNILLAIVGVGGLGSVIINAVANRKLNHAQETMTLAGGYEKRLAVLTSRICTLETTQEELSENIRKFKGLLADREETIEILQRENTELKKEVDRLQRSVGYRDARISELEGRVEELTKRLNDMVGKHECKSYD